MKYHPLTQLAWHADVSVRRDDVSGLWQVLATWHGWNGSSLTLASEGKTLEEAVQAVEDDKAKADAEIATVQR